MKKILFYFLFFLTFAFVFANVTTSLNSAAEKTEKQFIVDRIANNKAEFTEELKNQMEQIIKILNEKNWVSLKIVGHASSIGTDAYNLQLSKRRAENAKNFFVKKGIAGDRIKLNWKGESEPIADNSTFEGRAKNRRVEIFLTTLNAYPMPPHIIGVYEGEEKHETGIMNVIVEEGVEYTAFIDGEPYKLGTPYWEEGTHKITVIGKKNGLESKSEVNFTMKKLEPLVIQIDDKGPKKPYILGAEQGKVYPNPLSFVLEEYEQGVDYEAYINGIPYNLGTKYDENGINEIYVKATKLSNGLMSDNKLNFEIDMIPPKKPEIIGVSEGELAINPLFMDIKEREAGVEYSFFVDNAKYIPGAEYGKNGIHKIYVEAVKIRNGLSNSSSLNFEIDMIPPKKPEIIGVNDGEKLKNEAVLDIKEREAGVVYEAFINDKPYELGTEYKNKGLNNIKVNAKKTRNNLTASSEKSFTISKNKHFIIKGGANVYGKTTEDITFEKSHYESNVYDAAKSTKNTGERILETKISPIIGAEFMYPLNKRFDLGTGVMYEPKVRPDKEIKSYNYTIDYDEGDRDYYDDENKEYNLIPVYLTSRWNFRKNNWNAYLSGRVGYSFINEYNYHNFEDSKGGLYYGLGTGIEYKDFQIEVYYTVSSMEFDKEYQNVYGTNRDDYKDNAKVNYERINLTLGYWIY